MKQLPYYRTLLLLTAVLVSVTQASACPDCALINSGGIIEPQTVMAKMAFSFSTLFLLGFVFSVAGFMTWIMVKTCREFTKSPIATSSKMCGREP